LKKLTIIVPSFKEGKIIEFSIREIINTLKNHIDFEIIIIDDNSNDGTLEKIKTFSKSNPNIKIYLNSSRKGFGNSIKEGIKKAKGEFVCFFMADQSDDPNDILKYYRQINLGSYDCVFGDRWTKDQNVKGYPKFKFLINRLGNKLLAKIFKIKYTDITNSFKMYRKEVLMDIFPLISNHFSITIEIPLKVIYRGYKFKITPNSWRNHEHTISNLNLSNVIFTYSLILIYCRIEKYFMRH
jgi:dolichol-phosphate mannosyltransferase